MDANELLSSAPRSDIPIKSRFIGTDLSNRGMRFKKQIIERKKKKRRTKRSFVLETFVAFIYGESCRENYCIFHCDKSTV